MVLFSVLICFNSPFGSCEASLKSDGMKPVGKARGNILTFHIRFHLAWPRQLCIRGTACQGFFYVLLLYLWCLPWLLEQYGSNCGGRYQTEGSADALGFFIGWRKDFLLLRDVLLWMAITEQAHYLCHQEFGSDVSSVLRTWTTHRPRAPHTLFFVLLTLVLTSATVLCSSGNLRQ